MKGLADIVIALAELAEAEGELLRRRVIQLIYGTGLIGLSLAIILTGLGFLILAFYQSMLALGGPVTAALITGVTALLLGGLLQWLNHLNMR